MSRSRRYGQHEQEGAADDACHENVARPTRRGEPDPERPHQELVAVAKPIGSPGRTSDRGTPGNARRGRKDTRQMGDAHLAGDLGPDANTP